MDRQRGLAAGLTRTPPPIAAKTAAYAATSLLVGSAVFGLARYELCRSWRGTSAEHAVEYLQRWSRRAWRRLRLHVEVRGTFVVEPRIYVVNHRSYLDIPVLSGTLGVTFLSRADLATWPLVGTVAKRIGAVFVDRDDARGGARAARALRRQIGRARLAAFPEGTTTGGRLPAPFRLGLFRLLHRLRAPIVPVTIRYSDQRAYWTEDISLGRHLRTRVLTGPGLRCVVHVGAELDSQAHSDSVNLARAAYAAICRPIEECGELV